MQSQIVTVVKTELCSNERKVKLYKDFVREGKLQAISSVIMIPGK